MAIFGVSEDEFWAMTPHAYFAAVHAYRMAHDSEYRKRQEFAEFKKDVEGA